MKKLLVKTTLVVTFILLSCSYQASTESKGSLFKLVDTKGNCRIYMAKPGDGQSYVYFCECDYKYNCSVSR